MNRFIEITVPDNYPPHLQTAPTQKELKMSVSVELIRTFSPATDGGTVMDIAGTVLTAKESYKKVKELIAKEQKRSQRLSVITNHLNVLYSSISLKSTVIPKTVPSFGASAGR